MEGSKGAKRKIIKLFRCTTQPFSSRIWTTIFENRALINIPVPEFKASWVIFLKNHLRSTAQVKIIFQNVKGNAESSPSTFTLWQFQAKPTLLYVTLNSAEPLLLSFPKDIQKHNLFPYPLI